jgi:hypothetical protein
VRKKVFLFSTDLSDNREPNWWTNFVEQSEAKNMDDANNLLKDYRAVLTMEFNHPYSRHVQFESEEDMLLFVLKYT